MNRVLFSSRSDHFMKYLNNPYNIRSGSRWLGLSGIKNGFCEFRSLDFGIRAACILLMQSYRKKGCVRLSSIIYRFAPPSENNTGVYLHCVSSFADLPVNHIMTTTLDYAKVLFAMAWFETHSRISCDYILDIIEKFDIKIYSLTPKN